MNQPPAEAAQALKLGDTGYGLLGIGLNVNADPATGELVVSVVGAGGRISTLVGIHPVQIVLTEIARVPEAKVVELLKAEEDKQALAVLGRIGVPRASG